MSKGSHAVARRIALATALLAIGFLRIANAVDPAVPPSAQPTLPPPRPLAFDKNSALILIRSSLIAVQQANQTGNYSVLYGLSAPGFQTVNSPERLAQNFANLRAKNFDLSGVLVLEPQLTVLPEIYANGTMRMAGFFPSVPMQVYFELQFTSVEGQWRLVAISVDVRSATAPALSTPNPALASPRSPTPSPTATSARPSVEVRPAIKVTPTPHK